MNSFTLYADMVRYWRRPVFIEQRERVNPIGATAILGLICLVVLSLLPLTILQGLFFQLTGVGLPEPSEAFEAMNKSPNFVFMAVILAPLIEELLFRSWLGFRRGVLLVMPGLLLFFAVLGVLLQTNPSALELLSVVIACFAAAAYGWRWVSMRPGEAQQKVILRAAFPFVFWGTALCFGAMHHANFSGDFPIWAMPVVLLPLIFAGAVLGYIRMRFGLFIGIIFHGGYNGLIVLISTLAMMGVS